MSERSGRRTNERDRMGRVRARKVFRKRNGDIVREGREGKNQHTRTGGGGGEEREKGGGSEEDKRVSSSAFSCIPLCHGGQRLRHASSVLVVHSLRGQRAVRLRYTRLEERD